MRVQKYDFLYCLRDDNITVRQAILYIKKSVSLPSKIPSGFLNDFINKSLVLNKLKMLKELKRTTV